MKMLCLIPLCCAFVLITSCDKKKLSIKCDEAQNANDAVTVVALRDETYVGSPLYTGMVVNVGAVSVQHIPVDAASLGGGDYYTNSISPNGKYIVLPLGRQYGFGVYEVDKDLLKKVHSSAYDDVVRIIFKDTDTGKDRLLSHSFLRWESDSEFSFIVGMSRTRDILRYDVYSKELYAKDSIYIKRDTFP